MSPPVLPPPVPQVGTSKIQMLLKPRQQAYMNDDTRKRVVKKRQQPTDENDKSQTSRIQIRAEEQDLQV